VLLIASNHSCKSVEEFSDRLLDHMKTHGQLGDGLMCQAWITSEVRPAAMLITEDRVVEPNKNYLMLYGRTAELLITSLRHISRSVD